MDTEDIILAQRLPLWLSIEEKRSIGGWLMPCQAFPVGHVFRAGTPVQTGYIGEYPRFGKEAENPDGLVAQDTLMGEAGCTLSYVTRGALMVDSAQYAISRGQIDNLKKRITFMYAKEPDETVPCCFSKGYWMNAPAWLNSEPWRNR